VRSVITARCPDQEDDPSSEHPEALKAQLSVSFTVVIQRDHRELEDWLQFAQVDFVLPEVRPALRLVPGDHEQIVGAICIAIKLIVRANGDAQPRAT